MRSEKIIVIAGGRPISRANLLLSLKNLDYDIIGVPNGEKALELIIREQPDLLIADDYMPKISVVELINQLGKQRYEFPIIVNSVTIENIKKEGIKYNGKIEFRDKCSNLKTLFEKINSLLA